MSINKITNPKVFGKFLDQPILISKIDKVMPKILGLGGALYLAKQAKDEFKKISKIQNEKEKNIAKNEAKKDFLQKGIVMAFALTSAVLAPKIASKITNRTPLKTIAEVQQNSTELVENFIKSHKLNNKTIELLEHAKKSVLSFSQLKELMTKLNVDKYGKDFISKLIPDPENIKAKDIFSEIGYLSVYGAVPVVGGILGGQISDIATNQHDKEKMQNRISEGIYQYLANIFLCNIGAGGALAILEKLNITSKSARALGMVCGIILTGIIGGSKIANFISKKFINPILSKDKKIKERKPEPMDMFMHTDDVATVSVLSGLKWIEPALPILYSISGYKAGIGYRN